MPVILNRARGLLLGLAMIVALACWMNPVWHSTDDYVRYYYGGWIGLTQIAGGQRAVDVRTRVGREKAAMTPFIESRFVAATTPYSPLMILTTAVAERLRPRMVGEGDCLPCWMVAVQLVLWAGMALLAAAIAWRRLLPCSIAWTMASAMLLAWLLPHTSPLLPVPRGYCALVTGLALALLLEGRTGWLPMSLLALGAVCHPFQQALVVGIVGATVVLGWRSPGPRGWRPLVTASLVSAVAIAACWALCTLASASEWSVGGFFRDVGGFSLLRNWSLNWKAFGWVGMRLGLLIFLLTAWHWGWRPAVRVGVLMFLSVGAAASVGSSDTYKGELVYRVAGGWVAVAFALLLRRDCLFPPTDEGRPRVRRNLALAASVGAVLLFAFVVWKVRPIRKWTTVEWPHPAALGIVERACLRAMGGP